MKLKLAVRRIVIASIFLVGTVIGISAFPQDLPTTRNLSTGNLNFYPVAHGVYPNCAPPLSEGRQRQAVAVFEWPQEAINTLVETQTPGEIAVLDYTSRDLRCLYMRQLHAAGMHVGGYVNTGSGVRPEADVLADIADWFTSCLIDTPEWIFGDVGLFDGTDTHYAVYERYRSAVHNQYHACFMLNEGGALFDTGERVMALADVILWYEASGQRLGIPVAGGRKEHSPAWLGNYEPQRQGMTIVQCHPDLGDPIHSVEMRRAVATSQYLAAGYVYVFDGTTASYGHIPPYWRDEMLAVTSGSVTHPRPLASSLIDAFAGAEIDPALWWCSQRAGTCREEGSLILSLNDGPAGRVTVVSQNLWSLMGSRAFVDVPEVVGSGANNMFVLYLVEEREMLQWWYEGGMLHANYYVGGVQSNVFSVVYNPAVHRWWGFSEENGLVSFVTSSNGLTWTQRGSSVPDPFPLTSLYVRISARGIGAGAHGQARYANFNVLPATSGERRQ